MVILAVGLLIILNGVGVNVTPVLAALGVGGLAVALALSRSTFESLRRIFVTAAGQVRIGDYVRLDSGVEGQIQDFNWHSTRVQAPNGSTVIVPNAKVSQAIVTNYSQPTSEVGMAVDVVVDFASDMTTVERMTMEVARTVMKEVTGGIPDFEPAVRVVTYTDLGVRFTAGLRARSFADQALVRHEFLSRLQARFQDEGIGVPRYGMMPNPKIVSDR